MVIKCSCGVRYKFLDNEFYPLVCSNCHKPLEKPARNYVKPRKINDDKALRLAIADIIKEDKLYK